MEFKVFLINPGAPPTDVCTWTLENIQPIAWPRTLSNAFIG